MTRARRNPAVAPQPRGWSKGDGEVYRRKARGGGLQETWTARWWENGKQQSKSPFRDPESAWAYIARHRDVAATTTSDVSPTMTLDEYVTVRYLPALAGRVERGRTNPSDSTAVSPNTYSTNETTLRLYLTGSRLGRTRLRDITGPAVGDHLDVVRHAQTRGGKPVSLSTVVGHGKVLSAVLSHAAQRGALSHGNPFKNGTVPDDQRAKVSQSEHKSAAAGDWTSDHWVTFIEAMETYQHGIGYVLAIACGLRRGEVCGLQWRDISTNDRGERVIHVVRQMRVVNHRTEYAKPKTASGTRWVSVPSDVWDALMAWKRRQRDALLAQGIRVTQDTPVLTWVATGRPRGGQQPSPAGSPVHPATFGRGTADACKAAGVPVLDGTHGLRHTYITLALTPADSGGFGRTVEAVAKLVGHKDPRVTQAVYNQMRGETVLGSTADAIDTAVEAVRARRAAGL
jgi:integrase